MDSKENQLFTGNVIETRFFERIFFKRRVSKNLQCYKNK